MDNANNRLSSGSGDGNSHSLTPFEAHRQAPANQPDLLELTENQEVDDTVLTIPQNYQQPPQQNKNRDSGLSTTRISSSTEMPHLAMEGHISTTRISSATDMMPHLAMEMSTISTARVSSDSFTKMEIVEPTLLENEQKTSSSTSASASSQGSAEKMIESYGLKPPSTSVISAFTTGACFFFFSNDSCQLYSLSLPFLCTVHRCYNCNGGRKR